VRPGAILPLAALGGCLAGCVFDTSGLAPPMQRVERPMELRPVDAQTIDLPRELEARADALSPDLRAPDLLPRPDLPLGTCTPPCGGPTPICCLKQGSLAYTCQATAELCACNLGDFEPCTGPFPICCSKWNDLLPRCYPNADRCLCEALTDFPCEQHCAKCCEINWYRYECKVHCGDN